MLAKAWKLELSVGRRRLLGGSGLVDCCQRAVLVSRPGGYLRISHS